MTIKTYSELLTFPTFEERFNYLRLNGKVGEDTFGFDRYFNQKFYSSIEWRRVRNAVILRDKGCDLACGDREILGRIIIHHINPIRIEEIASGSLIIFDMENLVCVSHDTHNAIHYGDESLLIKVPVERKRNDTCPWKR